LRILGIDYGDRKIGLALSDRLGFTAQPLQSYRLKNKTEDEKFFKNLAIEYEITEVVVGFPLRMDGSTGTRGQKTQEFARWLEKILNLPIFLWDERLTTKQAQRILSTRRISPHKKKELEDQISAVIILSTYLENRKTRADADKNS
jgi:putative Holliday junction resolvase